MVKKTNKPIQGSSNIGTIIIFVIIVLFIIFGSIYIWQKYNLKSTENAMRMQAVSLQDQITKLKETQTKIQAEQDTSASSVQEKEFEVKSVILEDDVVYYINENDEKIFVVQSIDNLTDLKNVNYEKAELSPNKKFILLGSKGWEQINLEVYDVSTKKINKANASGSGFAEWLEDSRLKVVGECGMGISCGIYESSDNKTPWVLEKIQDF